MSDDRLHARRSELVEQALRALKEADAELDSLVAIERQSKANTDRLSKLGREVAQAIPDSEAQLKETDAWQQLHALKKSFSLMYTQIHQAVEYESRRFTEISNIMKTKHDTAKNSISNIR